MVKLTTVINLAAMRQGKQAPVGSSTVAAVLETEFLLQSHDLLCLGALIGQYLIRIGREK